MDVLSEVLRVVRLTGSIFFKANLHDPFAIDSPSSEVIIKQMPGRAECLTLFHIITEGGCWFKTENGDPFALDKGSVVIFPNGCAHTMRSENDLHPVPLLNLLNFNTITGLPDVNYGGQGDKTQFVCGYLQCDQRFNPLIGAIPEVLVLLPEAKTTHYAGRMQAIDSSSVIPVKRGGWLDMTLQQLIAEVKHHHEGSSTMITRLTELTYIEVLRRYMQGLPKKSSGWLAALRDREIGRALRNLHAHPEKKWSVEQLATEIGMSRSVFARRFTDLLGESPIRYLTGWRMQLAKNMLLKPEMNISMIAQKTGYDSDYTFNRAFKRHVGVPPGHWREKMTQQV